MRDPRSKSTLGQDPPELPRWGVRGLTTAVVLAIILGVLTNSHGMTALGFALIALGLVWGAILSHRTGVTKNKLGVWTRSNTPKMFYFTVAWELFFAVIFLAICFAVLSHANF